MVAAEIPRRTIVKTAMLGCAASAVTALSALAAETGMDNAPASPAAIPDNQKGTRLVLLGTQGGPNVRKYRSQPASLVVVDGFPYLVDCGAGVSRQLAFAGFDPSDISRIFLTHLHFDHIAGLPALLGFAWTRDMKPVQIYGPEGTDALLERAENFLSVPIALYAAELRERPSLKQLIQPHAIDLARSNLVYQDERVKVTAVENSHYRAMTNVSWPAGFPTPKSYSLRVDTPDRSIVFTGDTGECDAVMELAKGADILVSEVFDVDQTLRHLANIFKQPPEKIRPTVDHMRQEHLTPEDVGKMAQAAGVKLVVLSHIVMGLDDEVSNLNYERGIRKYFDGVVVTGRDLDQF